MSFIVRKASGTSLAAAARPAPVRTRIALLALVVALISLSLLPVLASAQTAPPALSSLIVKLAPGLAATDQAAVIARNGGIETSTIAALRLHIIQVPAADLAATLASYQADPDVASAEENRVRQSETVPTDPLYSGQWALPQISWDLAFATVTPTGSARVAVLDKEPFNADAQAGTQNNMSPRRAAKRTDAVSGAAGPSHGNARSTSPQQS